jgi:hypothetical protein
VCEGTENGCSTEEHSVPLKKQLGIGPDAANCIEKGKGFLVAGKSFSEKLECRGSGWLVNSLDQRSKERSGQRT